MDHGKMQYRSKFILLNSRLFLPCILGSQKYSELKGGRVVPQHVRKIMPPGLPGGM
jgi:hypothetical protein